MTSTGATGPAVPAVVTAPVTLPPNFSIHNIAALVRDLAVSMEDVPAILKKHGLTPAQYDSLTGNRFFRSVYEDAVKNWHNPANTKERVALGALITLEDALPAIGARMSNSKEELASVVETAKLFADLAGIGAKANQAPAPSEKFIINIDLGGDSSLHVEKTRPVAASVLTVQADGQGDRDAAALRAVLQTDGGDLPPRAITGPENIQSAVRAEPEGNSPDLPTHVETGL